MLCNFALFFDMDEVLVDLEGTMSFYQPGKRFKDAPDRPANTTREEFFEDLRFYALQDGFALARPTERFKELEELLVYAQSRDVKCAILTSVGSFTDHAKVANQKMRWLRKNSPTKFDTIPFLTVRAGREKAWFAKENSLLIDDHVENCTKFSQAGGKSFVFDTTDKLAVDKVSTYLKSLLGTGK